MKLHDVAHTQNCGKQKKRAKSGTEFPLIFYQRIIINLFYVQFETLAPSSSSVERWEEREQGKKKVNNGNVDLPRRW